MSGQHPVQEQKKRHEHRDPDTIAQDPNPAGDMEPAETFNNTDDKRRDDDGGAKGHGNNHPDDHHQKRNHPPGDQAVGLDLLIGAIKTGADGLDRVGRKPERGHGRYRQKPATGAGQHIPQNRLQRLGDMGRRKIEKRLNRLLGAIGPKREGRHIGGKDHKGEKTKEGRKRDMSSQRRAIILCECPVRIP